MIFNYLLLSVWHSKSLERCGRTSFALFPRAPKFRILRNLFWGMEEVERAFPVADIGLGLPLEIAAASYSLKLTRLLDSSMEILDQDGALLFCQFHNRTRNSEDPMAARLTSCSGRCGVTIATVSNTGFKDVSLMGKTIQEK